MRCLAWQRLSTATAAQSKATAAQSFAGAMHGSAGARRWDATLRSGFDSQRNDLRRLVRAERGGGDAWQSGGSAEHGDGVATQSDGNGCALHGAAEQWPSYAALRSATAKHCDAKQWLCVAKRSKSKAERTKSAGAMRGTRHLTKRKDTPK